MSTENSAADGADSGLLSMDDATALLVDPSDEGGAPGDDAGGAPAQDDEIPADPSAEELETAQPEEAADEGEEDPDAEEPPEPAAIEAPASWDAKAKAAFAQLPPEVQQTVKEAQEQRDRQTTEALQRAADTTRQAQVEAANNAQFRAHVAQLLPRAQKTFGDRWDNVDWATWAATDPTAAFQGQMQMAEERAQLQQLQQAQQFAQTQERQRFQQVEGQKLASLEPDLFDAKEGAARRQELNQFLNSEGIPNAVIEQADAKMLSLARDAMRYRALKAQAQQAPKKPTPPPAKPGQRPTPPRPGNSQSRQVDQLKNRLAQTGSTEDAIALLLARG